MFRFKQFTIYDDRCAMKVGTDGVLLGAWAMITPTDSTETCRVLDVGAGCGLVSLMVAQRYPTATITALEIDPAAAEQAEENVAQSPFASQVIVERGDFSVYQSAPYDAIVSNPPFYEEDLLPPDALRANARHTAAGLNFDILVHHSAELLKEGGSLHVIIPKNAQNRFHTLCNNHALTLVRATDVRTVERKDPKRVMLHFVKANGADRAFAIYANRSGSVVERDEIVLMANGSRSEAYAELCKDFYL